jgi:DNA polymerase-1
MPCIKVLSDIEDTGIAFDLEYARILSNKYHELRDEQLNEFYRILEMYKDQIAAYRMSNPNNKLSDPISINSPVQLAILFYDILGIKPVDEKSPRGTGVEILEKIDNPLCKAILDYRATEKLLSTYIDKLPECINANDGRIHCGLNQYGAKTGRMSSDNPNLQNIPSHNKDIRKMFIATNKEYQVEQTPENTFLVGRFTEVETSTGWKYSDELVEGDLLVVGADEFVKVDSIYVDTNRIEIWYSEC